MVTIIRIGLFDIDFVPRTSWHRSLACLSNGKIWFGYKRITIDDRLKCMFKRLWNRIRKRELLRAEFRCEICDSKRRLQVHEIWSYDDKRRIQQLVGYRVLCADCHRVHHSSYLLAKGDIDYVVDYIVSVNRMKGVSLGKVFVESKLRRAYEVWRERSNYMWFIDVSYEHYLFPVLKMTHRLLNYWIIEYRKSCLDMWVNSHPKTVHGVSYVDLNYSVICSFGNSC